MRKAAHRKNVNATHSFLWRDMTTAQRRDFLKACGEAEEGWPCAFACVTHTKPATMRRIEECAPFELAQTKGTLVAKPYYCGPASGSAAWRKSKDGQPFELPGDVRCEWSRGVDE